MYGKLLNVVYDFGYDAFANLGHSLGIVVALDLLEIFQR